MGDSIWNFLEQVLKIAQASGRHNESKGSEAVALSPMLIVHIYEVSGITGTISLEVHSLSRKVDALIGSDCVGQRSPSCERLRARSNAVLKLQSIQRRKS